MIKVIVQKGPKRRTIYALPGWEGVGKFLRWGKHVSIMPGKVADAVVKVWGV